MAFRYDGVIRNSVGEAIADAQVFVCTQPNTISPTNPTIPPSPLATIFFDAAGTQPITQPVLSDGNGNFFFYAANAAYTFVFFDAFNRIVTQVFPDQQVVNQGGGSVSSVGMTVPSELAVAGSPITGAGTFVLTKTNQNANLVAAGPAAGSPAPWGFRNLVSADLPAGTGTVTSVAASIVNGNPLFNASWSGSPITGAGTLQLTLNFNNQAANLILAGPASGGAGAISARKMVAADANLLTAVGFSATPVFDASTAAIPSFAMTLTGNVTSSSVSNPTTGQTITFIITQDGTGGRTFAWPANFKNASAIAADAGLTSVQSFIYDGTNWRATGPGSTGA